MIIWENKDIPSKRLKCKVVVSVKIWFRVVSVNSGVLCEEKTIVCDAKVLKMIFSYTNPNQNYIRNRHPKYKHKNNKPI